MKVGKWETVKFDKAHKVALADYEGEMVTDGEEFFISTADVDPDDLDDDRVNELENGTRFLWGTYPEKPEIDLETECRDSWLQEHHEDAFDQVDLKKLADAQKLVNEALAKVTTYYTDTSVAVILPPRPFQDKKSCGNATVDRVASKISEMQRSFASGVK